MGDGLLSRRLKLFLAWSFFLGVVLAQLAMVEGGHLSIDEVFYDYQARSAAQGHLVRIQNGFAEFASPELAIYFNRGIVPHDGYLVAKTPPFGPWLAAPLYQSIGFHSLFLVSILANAGTMIVVWLLAKDHGLDGGYALLAPFLLAFCTFSWEYAIGAWPHMLATFLSAASLLFLLRAMDRCAQTLWYAGLAGLFGATLIGVRSDGALIVLALLLIAVLSSRPTWKAAFCFVGGSLVPLGLLSWYHGERIGVPFPLVRNESAKDVVLYWRAAWLAIMGVLLAGARTRRGRKLLGEAVNHWRSQQASRRAMQTGAVLVGLGVATLGVPVIRRYLGDLWTLVFDLRALDMARVEPAMTRSAGHAVIYIDHVKKALLQSIPYLPICILAIRGAGGEASKSWRLAVPLLVLIAFFSASAWHGGLALNLRYFLAGLPGVTVLAAMALRRAHREVSSRWWWMGGMIAGTVGPLLLFFARRYHSEWALLTWPLVLSLGVLLAASSAMLPLSRVREVALRVLSLLVVPAVSWAALVQLGYDVPAIQTVRARRAETGRVLAKKIEGEAVLFGIDIDLMAGVIDERRVILALPLQDGFRSFRPLVAHHASRARSLYGLFPPALWKQLVASGHLSGMTVGEPSRVEGYLLARLAVSAYRSTSTSADMAQP